MTFILMLLYPCGMLLLALTLVAVVLNHTLVLLFKWLHIPNYTSASPSGILSWKNLAPPDILFRLASLASFTAVLYWLPIYYWTTYEGSGDERDGGLLFYAMGFSPIFWIIGAHCYLQSLFPRRPVQQRAAFSIASTLLLLIILSTLTTVIRFYIEMLRFRV